MINLHERMLPTSAGVEPATSWSPVGRRIQLSHRGRPCSILTSFLIHLVLLATFYINFLMSLITKISFISDINGVNSMVYTVLNKRGTKMNIVYCFTKKTTYVVGTH